MKKSDDLFTNKKENTTFKLFKQAFPKGTDFSNSKVYHIKSFEYSDTNIELFNTNKHNKDFYKILDKLEYNSQSNNVGIYYVIAPDGKGEVYMIAGPVELLEKEYIMRKYEEILDDIIINLSTVEQINLYLKIDITDLETINVIYIKKKCFLGSRVFKIITLKNDTLISTMKEIAVVDIVKLKLTNQKKIAYIKDDFFETPDKSTFFYKDTYEGRNVNIDYYCPYFIGLYCIGDKNHP